MSVHLPVLLRNASKWKETPQTSQYREELVAASKVEGAFYQYPSTSRQQQHNRGGGSINHNNKKVTPPPPPPSTSTTTYSPQSRKRDLGHNPEALKHFFLTHLPSASPSAERIQQEENINITTTTNNHKNLHHSSTSSSSAIIFPTTPSCLPTASMSFSARQGGLSENLSGNSKTKLPQTGARATHSSSASARRQANTMIAFGQTFSPSRFALAMKMNHIGEEDSNNNPVIPYFPSNPRQKKEDGEGPTCQTSSVRPRVDRAIWPAPSTGRKKRVIVSTSTTISMQDDITAGNNGSSSVNNNNNNHHQHHHHNSPSKRKRLVGTTSPNNKNITSTVSSSSQKTQDILAVKNIGTSNKILASLQQQQDREDGPDEEDDNNNDDEDDVLVRAGSSGSLLGKRQSSKSMSSVKSLPTGVSSNNDSSAKNLNNSNDDPHHNGSGPLMRRKSQSQQAILLQQQQAKANSVQIGLMLQKKHSTSVVGRAAQAEKLKNLLRNEVLFEDEEIALRMYQASLANASENGLLTEEQEQQLLDIQQQLLYGTPGYIAGVTGPRAIVNNANRFAAGGPATGPGNSLMSSGSGGGAGSGGGGGGGAGNVTTSGAGDLIADPSTSPLPFVSIFNGLFPSVSPQTFLYRYTQWVGHRRPKSPVHWSSFLPTPEDPQHVKDRHEKVGSLYVGSVSHEKDLFKSFLTDVSRSSQGFTDGFVRSVLRCLVDYEPHFFDQIVRTVADHCRREQHMNPQPRSILFQTKTLMREAEIQLRERTRKEEMQATTLKSHSLGSMYDLHAPLQQQQQSQSQQQNNNFLQISSQQQQQQQQHHARRASVMSGTSSGKRNSPNQSNLSVKNLASHGNSNNTSMNHHHPVSPGSPSSSNSGYPGSINNNNNNNNNNNTNTNYHHSQTNSNAVMAASQQQVTGVGGSGTLFSIREIFRAFVDASFTPIALRNLMVVCEFFDPHSVGAVPHYALTQKNFLLRYFEQAVAAPTLSQRANWENLLNAFEAVRQETEDFVNVMIKEEARENEERRRVREEAIRLKQEARRKSIMLKYSDNLQQQQLQLQLLQQELENEALNTSTISYAASKIENNHHNNNNNMTPQDSGDFSMTNGAAASSTTTQYPPPSSVLFYPASKLPPFAWFLAAFVGPRVLSPGTNSHHGKIATPVALLKALFAKHYDALPPPTPVPIADFRHLLLCDDRVVTVFQNYTIPECN